MSECSMEVLGEEISDAFKCVGGALKCVGGALKCVEMRSDALKCVEKVLTTPNPFLSANFVIKALKKQDI